MTLTNNKFGYIYIRKNNWYNMFNICKLGKTVNIPDRDSTYITSEIERGHFYPIYSVDINLMDQIEKELQHEFIDYHFYKGGGKELYSIQIINLIELFLKNKNYNYHILTHEEINLIYSNHENNYKINTNQSVTNIIPYDFQQDILYKIQSQYLLYDILKLIWPCGLGKALMSIFIVHIMKFMKVVICVPNIYLLKQIEKEILRLYPTNNNILKIGGNDTNSTNNKDEIYKFIEQSNDNCKFIISTYISCYILTDNIFNFDFKIGDEAHHLVGLENENSDKSFTFFHKIKSKKTLFMTATEKIIENTLDIKYYSMNDESVFGKVLDKKTVQWAIDNKKITDYFLLVLKNKRSS